MLWDNGKFDDKYGRWEIFVMLDQCTCKSECIYQPQAKTLIDSDISLLLPSDNAPRLAPVFSSPVSSF